MEVLIILLIWFVAPLVEMGFIIGLSVQNSRYKKRIEELERQAEQQNINAGRGDRMPGGMCQPSGPPKAWGGRGSGWARAM